MRVGKRLLGASNTVAGVPGRSRMEDVGEC